MTVGKWARLIVWLLVLLILAAGLVYCVIYQLDIPKTMFGISVRPDVFSVLVPEPTRPAIKVEPTEPEVEELEVTWYPLPMDRALTARQAFVYNCDTQSYLYIIGQKEDRVYPASITKLFTAYVALQYLYLDQEIVAGDVLDAVAADSSVAGIKKGNVLTVEMLVQAMLLPSGNDASYLLAAAAAAAITGDEDMEPTAAVECFVEEMNRQARVLGMTGSHFTNPDGYHDDDHYTSYQDLVIIGKLALENETIRQSAGTSELAATCVSGEVMLWQNTNALLNPRSPYYCKYATGLKTGYTKKAGNCLLSSFEYNGQQWLVGVFGSPEYEDRMADALQVFVDVICNKKLPNRVVEEFLFCLNYLEPAI